MKKSRRQQEIEETSRIHQEITVNQTALPRSEFDELSGRLKRPCGSLFLLNGRFYVTS